MIFERYLKLRSVRLLKEELTRDEIVSKVRVSRKCNPSGVSNYTLRAKGDNLPGPILEVARPRGPTRRWLTQAPLGSFDNPPAGATSCVAR
jgi:hypothetical protein